MELRNGWWMSKFHPKTFVPMEFSTSPLEENLFDQKCFSGSNQILFFCYFNNSDAFNEYLMAFRGHFLIIIGPKDNVGIHTDPLPLTPNIRQEGWKIVDCKFFDDNVNVICVYKRERN